MPKRDGTGPAGKGSGTGKQRGGCPADRTNSTNNAGRKKAGGNGGGGRGRGLNQDNNSQNK